MSWSGRAEAAAQGQDFCVGTHRITLCQIYT